MIDQMAVGGTENQLRLLLRNFDPNRVRPYLICLRDEEAAVREELGCEIFNLGVHALRPPQGVVGVCGLARLLRRLNIEVLVTFFQDSAAIGGFAGQLAGIPVVGSRRNIGYWHTPGRLRWLRIVNIVTDHFIANSQAARDVAVQVEGISRSAISVVYNAVDSTVFRPSQAPKIDRPLTIGCVGNLRKAKGHEILLEAFAKVKSQLSPLCLEIVGDGPERKSLEELASTLGISDSVNFMGSCSNVAQAINTFDIGVLPSHSESFSNAVLEYLASAVPVVATDVGGTREVVDSTVGRLVPPADSDAMAAALVELGVRSDLRRELGSWARQVAETRFSMEPILKQWYGVLTSVVCSSGRRAKQ